MTLYHDLKKQVYDGIRATPFTKIHGLPSFGLLPFIIGVTRFATDNPLLLPFMHPAQQPNSLVLPANLTAAQMRAVTNESNIQKRDWAVAKGFCKKTGEHIRDAFDLKFYAELEHWTYGYWYAAARLPR